MRMISRKPWAACSYASTMPLNIALRKMGKIEVMLLGRQKPDRSSLPWWPEMAKRTACWMRANKREHDQLIHHGAHA